MLLMELGETSQALIGGLALRQNVNFNSIFQTRAIYAKELRLVFIDHDNAINVADGMLFYAPHRPPGHDK